MKAHRERLKEVIVKKYSQARPGESVDDFSDDEEIVSEKNKTGPTLPHIVSYSQARPGEFEDSMGLNSSYSEYLAGSEERELKFYLFKSASVLSSDPISKKAIY